MSEHMVHLLRHGACETPGLLMGRTDGAPTPAGIAACADRTAGLDLAAIVSSDLTRARRAAEQIAARCGLSVTIDPRWRELDFGEWDGRVAAALDRAAIGRFWDDPDRYPPPGGEHWSTLVARVAEALGDVRSGTLVVAHGGALRAALAYLCGFPQPQLWAFHLPYAALVSLRIWPGEPPSAQIIGLRTQ